MLHYAAQSSGNSCIKWMFAKKATIDVNAVTNQGFTPIMCALLKDNLSASIFLIEKGANIFKKNADGDRAIEMGKTIWVLKSSSTQRISAGQRLKSLFSIQSQPISRPRALELYNR
jgi:hypothetical protein